MNRRTLELAAFCTALLVAALAVHAWLASRDEQQRLAATLAAQKQTIDAADASERANQSSLADALAQIEKLKRDVQTPAQILAALPKYLQLPQPITFAPVSTSEQGIAAPAQGSSVGAQHAVPGENPCLDAAHSATLSDAAAHVECGLSRAEPRGGLPADKAGLPPLSPAELARSEENANALPSPPSAQIPAADLKPLFDYVQDCRACQAELAAAQKNSADDAAKIAALTRERDAAITAAKGGSFLRRLRRNALWFAIGAAGGYAAARR
ncbi:MAG TPA: hypothetical protein VEJ46_15495 [Candidatus Acidoferrum sp.]|nr:hypothetical protein [Candidatus Acidoferrum sp.]